MQSMRRIVESIKSMNDEYMRKYVRIPSCDLVYCAVVLFLLRTAFRMLLLLNVAAATATDCGLYCTIVRRLSVSGETGSTPEHLLRDEAQHPQSAATSHGFEQRRQVRSSYGARSLRMHVC